MRCDPPPHGCPWGRHLVIPIVVSFAYTQFIIRTHIIINSGVGIFIVVCAPLPRTPESIGPNMNIRYPIDTIVLDHVASIMSPVGGHTTFCGFGCHSFSHLPLAFYFLPSSGMTKVCQCNIEVEVSEGACIPMVAPTYQAPKRGNGGARRAMCCAKIKSKPESVVPPPIECDSLPSDELGRATMLNVLLLCRTGLGGIASAGS